MYNLSVRYPNSPWKALEGISLKVEQGEVLGVVGESGSGKSTLALALLRLLPQGTSLEGKILYQGKDILRFSEKELENLRGGEISLVFQNPMSSLNPVFTIGFQLKEAIWLHQGLKGKQAEELARQALEKVGISNPELRLRQYPHELSGGQRQRVMIAMALSCKPKLLVADEPTTALDVTVQAQILHLFQKVQQEEKCSMILISHDLAVVWQLANSIAVLYGGFLVELGSKDQVLSAPGHPYTQGLLKSHPDGSFPPKTPLPALAEGEIARKGCPFAPRCPLRQKDCEKELPELRKLQENHWVRCPYGG